MIEFIIPSSLVSPIGKLLGGNPGPLSPWAAAEPVEEVSQDHWRLLQEEGLSDDGSTLKDPINSVLRRLMNPSRHVRVQMQAGPSLFDHLVYFPEDQKAPISFTSLDEGLLVRDPAPIEMIMTLLAEHWGQSNLRNSSLEMEVTPQAALAFCALADGYRRDILQAASRLQSPEVKPFTSESLAEETAGETHTQRLVTALRSFLSSEEGLDAQTGTRALEELRQEGVVEEENGSWQLVADGASFAGNFLLITQGVKMDIWQLEEESAVHATVMALQAGLHDNLLLDREEDKVILKAVSARYILDLAEDLIARGSGQEDLLRETSGRGPVSDPVLPPKRVADRE